MRYRKLFKNIIKNAGEIKILGYGYFKLAHIVGLLAEAAQGVNYIRAAKAPGVIPFVITVENILSSTVFASQCYYFFVFTRQQSVFVRRAVFREGYGINFKLVQHFRNPHRHSARCLDL